MSSLAMMCMQGIRCFGPNPQDACAIEFFSPVTLILGDNGCGKTSIIEAIKFATTGELPESTRSGNNFVHDPRLAGAKTEIKGQVKLKVKDTKGIPLIVTRNLQVIQKEKSVTCKQLEQTITRQRSENEWVSTSSKCADLNVEMCNALGVSKALLSNVILCHQEDSNWPLEEDSKVKKRFDEIFGAERFNKCLDTIRDVRKSYITEEKIMKDRLITFEEYKNEASQKRAKVRDEELRLLEYEHRMATFDAQLKTISDELEDLVRQEDEIGNLRGKQETLKANISSVVTMIADLKKGIQNEFKGTTSELDLAIQNFNKELGEKKRSLDQIQRECEDVNDELEKNHEDLNSEQVKLGQLNRDLERNKERVELRNNALLSLAEDLGICTTISQLSEATEYSRVSDALEEALSKLEDDLYRLKKDQKAQVDKLQADIDSCREEKASQESVLRSKKDELARTKQELSKVIADITEADQSTQRLGSLQTQLDRITRDYKELMSNNNFDEMQKSIDSLGYEKKNLEDKMASLEEEVQELQIHSKLQAELDVHLESKRARDSKITSLKTQLGGTLKHLLGCVPEQGIKFKLQARIDQLSDDVKMKKEELAKKDKELMSSEIEKKHLEEKLKNLKQSLEADEFAVSRECDGKDYDDYMNELSNKLKSLQDQKGSLASFEYTFRQYVHKLKQESPCCPLCERGFSKEDEVTQLISRLNLKVKEVPSDLRKNKEDLDRCQAKYDRMMQLKPRQEKLSILREKEIPQLERQLEKLDKKISTAKEERDRLKSQLEVPVEDESIAKSIQGDVAHLDQMLTESETSKRDIQRLESAMPPGSRRPLQEAMDEQKALRLSLQSVSKDLDAAAMSKNRLMARKHELEGKKISIKEEQFKISGNVQMRHQLAERRDQLLKVETGLQNEIDLCNKQSQRLSLTLDQTVRNMKKLVDSNIALLDEQNERIKITEQKYREIKNLNKEIDNYDLSGSSKKLEKQRQRIETLNVNRDRLMEKKKSVSDKYSDIKNDITFQQIRERDLNDNRKLREKRTEQEDLNARLKELSTQIGNMDYRSIFRRKNELSKNMEDLQASRAQAEGSRQELKKSIKNFEQELEKDNLKFADQRYVDQKIKLDVLKQTMADLDSYYKALDWALMSYHTKRLEHVNRVIAELWGKIYSGTDIDKIEIQSESEEVVTAGKRRAFKYRVIQRKQGVDIEMRGRCSAGQKVLACLIIRIALADTFSSHCGILALDEPTTNLDHHNIHNLTLALRDIIRTHAHRMNFQLLIITHDKHFLSMLEKECEIDHYYLLERDSSGKSHISKENANSLY